VSAPVIHPSEIKHHSWSDQLKRGHQRIGVMLHYDASASDRSGLVWLSGAEITVSYNWVVTDAGNIIAIAPETARAWHAGYCKSPDPRLHYRDANSAFYGVSLLATAGDVASLEAKRSIVGLCRTYFLRHRWPTSEAWRIVSHRQHAVFEPGSPRAGEYGRKNDPEGPDLAHPVLSVNEIRGMLVAHT
jgi:N-acetyl-anhydromuramyl-L-alanine amidase AmpD